MCENEFWRNSTFFVFSCRLFSSWLAGFSSSPFVARRSSLKGCVNSFIKICWTLKPLEKSLINYVMSEGYLVEFYWILIIKLCSNVITVRRFVQVMKRNVASQWKRSERKYFSFLSIPEWKNNFFLFLFTQLRVDNAYSRIENGASPNLSSTPVPRVSRSLSHTHRRRDDCSIKFIIRPSVIRETVLEQSTSAFCCQSIDSSLFSFTRRPRFGREK